MVLWLRRCWCVVRFARFAICCLNCVGGLRVDRLCLSFGWVCLCFRVVASLVLDC